MRKTGIVILVHGSRGERAMAELPGSLQKIADGLKTYLNPGVEIAGAALQFLGVCYWLIDVRGRRGWARPAVAMGMNPLAIFALSILVVKIITRVRVPLDGGSTSLYAWLYRTLFVPWLGLLNGSLGFAIAYLILWWGVAELLYRRRIFIKV